MAVLWVVLTSVFIQSCKSDTDSFSSDLAAQQKAASLSLSWEKGLSRCIRFSGPILQKYGLSLIDYQLSDLVGSDEINKGIASRGESQIRQREDRPTLTYASTI